MNKSRYTQEQVDFMDKVVVAAIQGLTVSAGASSRPDLIASTAEKIASYALSLRIERLEDED